MGLGPLICSRCNCYVRYSVGGRCPECFLHEYLIYLFDLSYEQAVAWDKANDDNLHTFYKEYKQEKEHG